MLYNWHDLLDEPISVYCPWHTDLGKGCYPTRYLFEVPSAKPGSATALEANWFRHHRANYFSCVDQHSNNLRIDFEYFNNTKVKATFRCNNVIEWVISEENDIQNSKFICNLSAPAHPENDVSITLTSYDSIVRVGIDSINVKITIGQEVFQGDVLFGQRNIPDVLISVDDYLKNHLNIQPVLIKSSHPDLIRLGILDAWEVFVPVRETKDEQEAWCLLASALADSFGWMATGGVGIVNAYLL